MPRVSLEKWKSMSQAQKSKVRASLGTKKKTYQKKYKNSSNLVQGKTPQGTSLLLTKMPIFPVRTSKRLRYSTFVPLTSTSGAVTSWVFSANGLFDPDISGTGHQPMGFDQMMLFYNHYCCTWAKMTIVANCMSTTAGAQIVLRQDASSTPITVIDRLLEMGGSVSTHLDVFGSNNSQKELSLIINTPKLQGITNEAALSDNQLRGDSANNPVEQSYFHLQLFNSFGDTTSCRVDVIIEYISYFMEPRDQIQS